MDKKPKISCIMAVYNTRKYLDECIQSILSQTYTDFEFIISDDGSTDGSKEIIRKYAKKDKRIVFLDNKVNRGIMPNLIDCINKAKGDYIAIMESDDVSYPERFDSEIKAFEKNSDLYLVGGHGYIIDEMGNIKSEYQVSENFCDIKKSCLSRTPFITPGVMFKKELGLYLKRVKYPYIWDVDFFLNVIFSNKNCTNIHNFIIKKRDLDGSLFYRKYLKIHIQFILLRLNIAHKYKLYKENKLIYFQITRKFVKQILIYYFVCCIKKLGIYEYIRKIYYLCFKD